MYRLQAHLENDLEQADGLSGAQERPNTFCRKTDNSQPQGSPDHRKKKRKGVLTYMYMRQVFIYMDEERPFIQTIAEFRTVVLCRVGVLMGIAE